MTLAYDDNYGVVVPLELRRYPTRTADRWPSHKYKAKAATQRARYEKRRAAHERDMAKREGRPCKEF